METIVQSEPTIKQSELKLKPCEPEIAFYYKEISHQIEREDGLINNRLTQLLTSAGLLFAAFAYSISAESKGLNHAMLLCILLTLPILGFVISYFALASVRAAEGALFDLKMAWERRVNKDFKIEGEEDCHDHRYFPRPYGNESAWRDGHSFNKALPVLIGITWLAILLSVAVLVLKTDLYNDPKVVSYSGAWFLRMSRVGFSVFALTGVVGLFLRSRIDSESRPKNDSESRSQSKDEFRDYKALRLSLELSLGAAVLGLIPAIDSASIAKLSPAWAIATMWAVILIGYALIVASMVVLVMRRIERSDKAALLSRNSSGNPSKEEPV
ncbi:MAG TPA: hypothetical protein VF173_03975 [Thermoanaerobaculia bacterium]|nr:hypothetical protein [Thermoanaerobaculia bacterium]